MRYRLISVHHKQKQYLASAYNYARFYLDRLLPRDVHKVVWLDSDAIVTRPRPRRSACLPSRA